MMNDFLDNLGAEQYQKMHNKGNAKRPRNPEEEVQHSLNLVDVKGRLKKYVKELFNNGL
jgi:hypothetical protein|tara:strand:- start:221 stop:397 length:177 start_codon:yes stop_codon:yes gene_type:complete